jgi:hypothetical protein
MLLRISLIHNLQLNWSELLPEANKIMKTKLTLIGTVALLGFGCSSTLTVGPAANKSSYLGANASTKGASVTVPFVKGSISRTETESKTKKKK